MDSFVLTITFTASQVFEAKKVRQPNGLGMLRWGGSEALLRTTKISTLTQPSHTVAPGIVEQVRSQTGKKPESGRGSNFQ